MKYIVLVDTTIFNFNNTNLMNVLSDKYPNAQSLGYLLWHDYKLENPKSRLEKGDKLQFLQGSYLLGKGKVVDAITYEDTIIHTGSYSVKSEINYDNIDDKIKVMLKKLIEKPYTYWYEIDDFEYYYKGADRRFLLIKITDNEIRETTKNIDLMGAKIMEVSEFY